MSSTNESSPPAAEQAKDEKPRLTDDQKKQNHIASEQKRRQAIRQRYDRLTDIVPGLEGQSRSEGVVLKGTVDFIHKTLQRRQQLIAQIENAGGEVDEKLKKPLYHYTGPRRQQDSEQG